VSFCRDCLVSENQFRSTELRLIGHELLWESIVLPTDSTIE